MNTRMNDRNDRRALIATFAALVSVAPLSLANGNSTVSAPASLVAPGDCQVDGVMDVLDVLVAAGAVAGLPAMPGTQPAACDVDGQEGLGVTDALAIAQMSLGLRAMPGLRVEMARLTPNYILTDGTDIEFRMAGLASKPYVNIEVSFRRLDASTEEPATITSVDGEFAVEPGVMLEVPVHGTGDKVYGFQWSSLEDVFGIHRTSTDRWELRLRIEGEVVATFGPFFLDQGTTTPAQQIIDNPDAE